MSNLISNPELELAWRCVTQTNRNVFLTGKAGTGKTTFLRQLKERSNKRIVVLAPTGVAAINAGGVTIHSFLQLPFGLYVPNNNGFSEEFKMKKEKLNVIRSMDLLVIDEISMVRADLLDLVDHALKYYRRSQRPFGGVQLLLIGDIQQLSPVVKDDEIRILREYYQSIYFFSSHALQKTAFTVIELKQIFRQSDQHFLNILNQIRTCTIDESTLAELNSRYIPNFPLYKNDDYIRLMTHNRQADDINQTFLSQLKGKTGVYQAEVVGTFPESMFPAEKQLALKVGAKVMFIKNDSGSDRQYYNGKIGEVIALADTVVKVKCDDGVVVEVGKETWTNARYVIDPKTKEISEKIEGVFLQVPLRLAWAITIHKSQGLTFDKVIINATEAFAHGQVYVALSRCRTLEGIVLAQPINTRALRRDNSIESFETKAYQEKPTPEIVESWEHNYINVLTNELFYFGDIFDLVAFVESYYQTHLYSLYPNLASTIHKVVEACKELNNTSIGYEHNRVLWQSQPKNAELVMHVQQKFAGAVNFFTTHIGVLDTLLEYSTLDIDNATKKERWQRLLDDLNYQVVVKRAVLNSQKGKTLDITTYLKARSEAAIDVNSKASSQRSDTNTATLTVKKKNKTYAFDDAESEAIYNSLVNWRKEKANAEKKPVYIILNQKALINIAEIKPTNLVELKKVNGIGPKTLVQYGEVIISIVMECLGL